MKLTYRIIGLCLCFSLLFTFSPAHAQEKKYKKVTLEVKNATFEEIIQSVKKQTGVNIVYNQEVLKKVPKMNFKAKDEELRPLMLRLLKNLDLTFVLQGDVMVIGPKEDEAGVKKKLNLIKGQVLDANGKPLVLVTINVAGTNRQTSSAEGGKFTVAVEDGKNLIFSSVGFKSRMIKPSPSEQMNVILDPEENDMEEVVVTGYQEVNKRLSASSTYTLKGTEVKENGVSNIVSMLQGKVPGLSVVNTSGSPNSVPKMRLRGTSTLIGNANPIIVVDGFIRENPTTVNPENIMGLNPSGTDLILGQEAAKGNAALMGNSISGLNVNDIESITFLKDASATAIYGTSAANGVIVITTKRGKAGKLEVNYSMNTGFTQKPSYDKLNLMNSQERIRMSREMYEDGNYFKIKPLKIGYEGALFDLLSRNISEVQFQNQVSTMETMNTDWFDVLFKNSLNTSHHLSFSGGSDKLKVYSSIFYDQNANSAKEDWQKRLGASVRLGFNFSKKLELNFGLEGNYNYAHNYFALNPLDYALKTSRTISPYEFYPTTQPTTGENSANLIYNFLNEVEQSKNHTKSNNVNSLLSLKYTPVNSLTIMSMASANINDQKSEQYVTERTLHVANLRGYDFGAELPGSVKEQNSGIPYGGLLMPKNTSSYVYSLRNSIEFNKRLFNDRDQVVVQGGMDMKSASNVGYTERLPGYLPDRGESFFLVAKNFPLIAPVKTNVLFNTFSAYGIASYTVKEKYVLNANIRTNASNRFGQYASSRFLPIWSVAGRWNVSSEEWLKNSKVINQLDIKASFGFEGNVVNEVGPDLILTIPRQGMNSSPLSQEYILKLKSLPYPDLKWEKTKSYNVELHTSLFNSFLDLTAGYYEKRTTDAITTRKIPVEYGGVGLIYVNGGNIKNSGYELNVRLNPVRTKDVNWTVSFNTSKNFNSLREGVNEATYKLHDYLDGTVRQLGMPLSTFYVYKFKGLNPKNGLPMFYHIDDELAGKIVNNTPFESYLVRAGSRDPSISGGLFNNFRYKSFTFGASFSFSLGAMRLLNPIYSNIPTTYKTPMPEQNMLAVFSNRWRKPGDELYTNIPGFLLAGNDHLVKLSDASHSRYYMYDHSDERLVSSDFIRCRSLSMTYQFDPSWLKNMNLKQVSIRADVNNLFTIADKKFAGQDPEIASIVGVALPITRGYSLGLNVSF